MPPSREGLAPALALQGGHLALRGILAGMCLEVHRVMLAIGFLSGVVKVRFVGVGRRGELDGCSAAAGPDTVQAAAVRIGSKVLVQAAD
jgi:hypothetical protein